MRSLTLSWLIAAVALTAGSTIAACGSESNAEFPKPSDVASSSSSGDNSASGSSSSGATVFGGGVDDDGGAVIGPCVPKTCTDLAADCGVLNDGCGGVVECGNTCPTGQTCGGLGTVGKCGVPPCTAKTCAQLGVQCGPTGDGCGGLIADCGTCATGTCGGGGASKCGGVGDGGVGDGGTCVPTKTVCGPGDCGPIANGCGVLLNCGNSCPNGQTCGGGGVASQCGAPACTKATCASVGGANCGSIADGCGGLVSCWPAGGVCPPGQTCGGAGTANHCGTSPTCTGLCLQQQGCAGGGTTSIEGYVTSPNGTLPIPNAVVYVANGAVQPFTPGVACEQCAAPSGNPLVTTTTDANGHFYLPNMPVSSTAAGKVNDIPMVAQLGRWRKQFTVRTTACTNTTVRASGTLPWPAALPRDKTEGDIPLTAISTGNVDALECVFKKIGVSDAEFTPGDGTGRIRLYPENGACASGGCTPNAATLYGPATANAVGTVTGATNASPIVIQTSAAHGFIDGAVVTIAGVRGNTAARGTWNITVVDATHFSLDGSTGNGNYTNNGTWSGCAGAACAAEIDKYDAVIFGCEGGENAKPTDGRENLVRYANKGGRVFATHFSYVWLQPQYPWSNTVTAWNTASPPAWDGNIQTFLDTGFPKGVLFSNWLQAPVGPTSATFPPPYANVNGLYSNAPASILLTQARRNIKMDTPPGVSAGAQRWAYTTAASTITNPQPTDPAAAAGVMHYTFNTDYNKPPAAQCGRVTFSDFHVTTTGSTGGVTFPAECATSGLTSQEKVLAYMLFDLASCVSTTPPQTCQAKTCGDQAIGCGPAGDGCGNVIQCGNCPTGQTCGGGGIPSQCGAPACTPRTCAAGQCGQAGDGCGGTLTCATCGAGQTCGGGGTAGVCGTGTTCNPSVCPTPAPNSVCGPVANGCGGVNNCGCAAGVPCVNGTCGVPACTPRTCAQAGANCGQLGDGCGGTLACGGCVDPQTCGGGGIANVCGGGVR